MSTTTPFCVAELEQALKEQAFAITSFTLFPSSSETAIASVVLLEGEKVDIQLTLQGYSIANASNDVVCVHETLEDLLQSISPLYATKRQEALVAALSRLS